MQSTSSEPDTPLDSVLKEFFSPMQSTSSEPDTSLDSILKEFLSEPDTSLSSVLKSEGAETKHTSDFNIGITSVTDDDHEIIEELMKLAKQNSLLIQQDQKKEIETVIQKEIDECMFCFKLETILPCVYLTAEGQMNQILKEQFFDSCNEKIISLQKNYKDYITEQQQQQINELQNTINYFYQNPQMIIKLIKRHSFKLEEFRNKKNSIVEEMLIIQKKVLEEKIFVKTKKSNNVAQKFKETEIDIALQRKKDNNLNQPEKTSIKQEDYIKLLNDKLLQKDQELEIMEKQIENAQEAHLKDIVQYLVQKEKETPSNNLETASNNLATASNNLAIVAPSANANSTENPNILPIGIKRKSTSDRTYYPAKGGMQYK